MDKQDGFSTSKTPVRKRPQRSPVRKSAGNRPDGQQRAVGGLPTRTPVTRDAPGDNGPGGRKEAVQEKKKKAPKRVATASKRKEPVVRAKALPKYKQREAAYKQKVAARAAQDSSSTQVDPDLFRAREMAYLYEEALGIYRNQPSLTYFKKRFDLKSSGFREFLRAAQIAEAEGVNYSIFLQAQFYWFDKWFKRPPKPFELRGEKSKVPAPERVRRFLALKKKGEITEKHVTGMGKLVTKIDADKLDAVNQQRLNSLMRAWSLSEEETLIRFSRPGIDYFDADWLRRYPTAKKLRQQGKL